LILFFRGVAFKPISEGLRIVADFESISETVSRFFHIISFLSKGLVHDTFFFSLIRSNHLIIFVSQTRVNDCGFQLFDASSLLGGDV